MGNIATAAPNSPCVRARSGRCVVFLKSCRVLPSPAPLSFSPSFLSFFHFSVTYILLSISLFLSPLRVFLLSRYNRRNDVKIRGRRRGRATNAPPCMVDFKESRPVAFTRYNISGPRLRSRLDRVSVDERSRRELAAVTSA